jgi:hypothetical protein
VSLEQLHVVKLEDIQVAGNRVLVSITPTIPHCSMATLIGTFLSHASLRAVVFHLISNMPNTNSNSLQAYHYESDFCGPSHPDFAWISASSPEHTSRKMQ